jgi:L-lactate utilization protein LutB
MNDLLKMKKEREDQLKQMLDNIQNVKDNNDLREYFDRWRDAAKKMKQDSLDNLANKLNDILTKAKKRK